MGTPRTANSPVSDLSRNISAGDAQSTLRQRGLEHSEIRGLAGGNVEPTRVPELGSHLSLRETIAAPPLTLESAADHYGQLANGSPELVRALETGDLPRAILTLIQENFQLRGQNASWQSDFEELRSVNIAQQQEADARLAASDEERLQLLAQLDRARSDIIELENEYERARRDHADDLEVLRQERDALQQELFELKARG